jgi:hydroxymethylbilane synthase
VLRHLDDAATRHAVLAERALLRGLGGGCLVPVGVVTEFSGEQLHVRGAVFSPDGVRCLDGRVSGPCAAAEELGSRLARDLLDQGAGEILARNEV